MSNYAGALHASAKIRPMDLQTRRAAENDLGSILKLLYEFAEYEDLSDFLEITEEKLHDAMFGERSFLRALIALDQETPIAYALFYPAFLSFRGQRSVYLEDIFITQKYRNCGIGEKMLCEVAKIGKEDFGAARMDFQVLKSNKAAIKFYKKHGALIDGDERHFKFVDLAFEDLTKN